jgi:hypothetical protein
MQNTEKADVVRFLQSVSNARVPVSATPATTAVPAITGDAAVAATPSTADSNRRGCFHPCSAWIFLRFLGSTAHDTTGEQLAFAN